MGIIGEMFQDFLKAAPRKVKGICWKGRFE